MIGAILIAVLLLVSLGGGLTIYALRGRQIDNHPICRSCGFDLFALDAAEKCPECGAELSAPAIRLGHRAVRRGILAIGLIMGTPSLVILVAVTIAMVKHVNFERYKPVWLLIREGDSPAIEELRSRLASGHLSNVQIESVSAAGIRAHANAGPLWVSQWCNLIEELRAAGKLNDEQWKQYGRNAVVLTLTARTHVLMGDPLPLRTAVEILHVSSHSNLDVVAEIQGVWLDDWRLPSGNFTVARVRSAAARFPYSTDLDLGCNLVPGEIVSRFVSGPHTLRVRVGATVLERPERHADLGNRFVCSFQQDLSAPVTLVAEERQSVEPVRDSELRSTVEGSLSAGEFGDGRHLRIAPSGAHVALAASKPPVGLAFDVFARDPSGRDWPMSSFRCAAGSLGYCVSFANWDGFNADRVDLILRPSRALAVATVELTRIWDQEIRIRDMPVIWDKGASRPSTTQATTRSSR